MDLMPILDLRWRPGDAGTPKLMYLNPTGSNPTGAVLSPQRRQEIYEICSMYDILILEDDPYYFMQFRETIQCCGDISWR